MEAPVDQYRDPDVMERVRRIAAEIFARYHIDFASARRMGGYTNATYIAGGLVLRVATKPGMEKLRREAALSALLPPQAGYPPVIESGLSDDLEWCLSREIIGENLGEAMQRLNWQERTSALCQLWQMVLAVQSVDPEQAAKIARTKPWFNATSAEDADAALTRLTQQQYFTPPQAQVLRGILNRFWQVRPGAQCVLNHGDLTTENALYHNGRVVSLLDFEFAVMAPAELDLNELVKMAFAPMEITTSLPDPDGSGKRALQQAVIDLAKPIIDHPGGVELLLGYAVLLELWMFTDWLAHPEGEGPVETWMPYRLLQSLAQGDGGYLAPLLLAL